MSKDTQFSNVYDLTENLPSLLSSWSFRLPRGDVSSANSMAAFVSEDCDKSNSQRAAAVSHRIVIEDPVWGENEVAHVVRGATNGVDTLEDECSSGTTQSMKDSESLYCVPSAQGTDILDPSQGNERRVNNTPLSNFYYIPNDNLPLKLVQGSHHPQTVETDNMYSTYVVFEQTTSTEDPETNKSLCGLLAPTKNAGIQTSNSCGQAHNSSSSQPLKLDANSDYDRIEPPPLDGETALRNGSGRRGRISTERDQKLTGRQALSHIVARSASENSDASYAAQGAATSAGQTDAEPFYDVIHANRKPVAHTTLPELSLFPSEQF